MEFADEQVVALVGLLGLPTYELRLGEDGVARREERSGLERLIEERFRPVDIAELARRGDVVRVALPIRLNDLLIPMSYGFLVAGPFFSEPIGEEEFSLLPAAAGIQEQTSSYGFYRSLPYLSAARADDLAQLLARMLRTDVLLIDRAGRAGDDCLMRRVLDAEFEEGVFRASSDLYVRCARALSNRNMPQVAELSERYARLIERTPREYFPLQKSLVRNEYVLMCATYHEVRRSHAAQFVSYLGQRLEACEGPAELARFQQEMTGALVRKLAEDDLAGLPPAIVEVRLYIHDHYREHIRLEDLARVAGLSPARLSALFHETCGMSVSACILGRRIEQAQRLLLYSQLSTAEIGGLVGFPDASYFSRRFRQATGVTPREYRRTHGGAGAGAVTGARPGLNPGLRPR